MKNGTARIGRWVTVILLVTVLVYVIGYGASLNSDAYKVNREFIKKLQLIQDQLGSVESVSLKPFGYELEFSGSSGKAEFESNVVGSRQTSLVTVVLKKSDGIWHVINAKLKSQEGGINLPP